MAKTGDTVRYLNAVGGGVITRIDGKIAYVDEDGFETPVLLKDIVVVLPAGHEPKHKGANLMFDQKAFDNGRKQQAAPEPVPSKEVKAPEPAPEPVALTPHGDKLSLAIAFEPTNLKNLPQSKFNALLVNDSNYTLLFSFLKRGPEQREWSLVFSGELPPNELMDLDVITYESLVGYERVALQGIAFRKDAPFEMKAPFSMVRRLDLTKFHKFHCFRPGIYFSDPVLEVQLMDRDVPKGEAPGAESLRRLAEHFSEADYAAEKPAAEDSRRRKKAKAPDPADNPNKLLPLIEVDLHIGELTDSTAGMDNTAMLQMQLDAVRETMKANSRRQGQKIVFIHGKGEGVLRKAVLALLKKEYPKCELQDASFREYGFGATLVTVHT